MTTTSIFPIPTDHQGVSKDLLSSALPVGFGLNLSELPRRLRSVTMPTLGVMSRKYRTARATVSRNRRGCWRPAFMATSVGPRLPRSPTSIASRHAKLLMKIDDVTVMVVHLAATAQLTFNRQQ